MSGTNAGEWQSVTVTWKDQTQWHFTPLSGNTYSLTQITNRVGRSINLTWNAANRTLTQIADATSGTILLSLTYGGLDGQLTSADDAYGRRVVYTYEQPYGVSPGKLISVSQVGDAGATPPARWTYTYTDNNGQQLNSISVPNPTGSGTSTVNSARNHVSRCVVVRMGTAICWTARPCCSTSTRACGRLPRASGVT